MIKINVSLIRHIKILFHKSYNNYETISAYYFILFLLFFFFNLVSVYSQTFPKSPEPWREEYNISLKGFTFQHPMTVINKTELEINKTKIENKIEPQYSAYHNLLIEAQIQLNFIPDPPETMDIMGGYEPNSNLPEMREWLWRNCHAAYTCGLAYAYSGEVLYAEKAKEILMDWANKGTTFTGQDRGLQLGSWFSPMLCAADLIYDHKNWTETERDIFFSWWRNNCLYDGAVLDVMRSKDNNWKDAGLLGVMSAAVVLEDTLLLKEGLVQLTSYFFNRTDQYVRLPGKDWKIKKDNNGVYLPREVVRNDGRSGLTYTAYALTTMVQAIEIARYTGFNFWGKKTEEGVGLDDVINQYFAWDIKRERFPWNNTPNRTNNRRNIYELAISFLNIDNEIRDWVMNQWPVINGREGDEYVTLNKGDILGTGIIPPAAPSELNALPLYNREIKLNWKDNSNNETGFNIERKTINSSYFTIAQVDEDSTNFVDKFLLSDSTTYIYRIKAINNFTSSDYSNEFTVTTLPVKVSSDLNILPNEIKLYQNYPNPFNPTTRISYSIPNVTSDFSLRNITLKVYDVLGEEVAILVNKTQSPGKYEVNFDASNLPTGIYIYKLQSEDQSTSKKFVLIQ